MQNYSKFSLKIIHDIILLIFSSLEMRFNEKRTLLLGDKVRKIELFFFYFSCSNNNVFVGESHTSVGP
jgi:hypothetical protein